MKRKRIIIKFGILVLLIIFLFRNTIMTDIIFLRNYNHFASIIEIIKSDYMLEQTDICRIHIRDGMIYIFGNEENQSKGLYKENVEMANEISAIYGQSDRGCLEAYKDDSGKIAVIFYLRNEKLLKSEKMMTYSIVYVEEGFKGTESWMGQYEDNKSKSDYIDKKNWYRWRERSSTG